MPFYFNETIPKQTMSASNTPKASLKEERLFDLATDINNNVSHKTFGAGVVKRFQLTELLFSLVKQKKCSFIQIHSKTD